MVKNVILGLTRPELSCPFEDGRWKRGNQFYGHSPEPSLPSSRYFLRFPLSCKYPDNESPETLVRVPSIALM